MNEYEELTEELCELENTFQFLYGIEEDAYHKLSEAIKIEGKLRTKLGELNQPYFDTANADLDSIVAVIAKHNAQIREIKEAIKNLRVYDKRMTELRDTGGYTYEDEDD